MQSLLNFTPSAPLLYWTGSEGDLVPENVTRAEVLDDKIGFTYLYEGNEENVTLTRHGDGTYRQVKSDDGYRGLRFDREGFVYVTGEWRDSTCNGLFLLIVPKA